MSNITTTDFLAQGIRFMALKKWSDACDSFSRAVEALTEKYGELAPEAGEALMLYGKALLNNAVAQSDVLGGAPEDADKRDEDAKNAVAGPSSGAPAAGSSKFHFGGDEEEEEEEEEEGESGDEEAAGEVEDDLETAFMMLDTARAIYEKVEGDEAKMKVAEIHRLLGDVASEGAQFDNAVAEYSVSLTVLAGIVPPYSRALSELHMLIALALDFVPDAVARAVDHAEKAKAVLLLKLAQLGEIEGKTERDEKEIVDITELMGDVDMKIEDLKTVPIEAPKSEAEQTIERLIQNAAAGSGKINNLNSLVKKKKPVVVEETVAVVAGGEKRKAEEEISEVPSEKKTKGEATA